MAKSTTDILKNLVPLRCQTQNGRIKGVMHDWNSEEGEAVNKALLALSKIDEIREIIEPYKNFNTENECLEEIKKIIDWGSKIQKKRRLKLYYG